MADIYRNSFVTIAAVSSPDSHGGCFSPEITSDVCLRLEGHDFESFIAARYSEGDGTVSDLATFEKAFPILTRAWVYQERMLSRRVLSCNHREFQFECREGNTCECGNRYMPPHTTPNTVASLEMVQAKSQYAELEQSFGTTDGYTINQLCQHWQKTVMQYAKLRLTKESDTLPALSGCAQDFHRLVGDKYLAGLWRSSFAQGLLWTVNAPVDQPRPDVWRAPSWTWASLNTSNGIKYIFPQETWDRDAFQNRIEAAECVPVGADQTGGIESGYVRIRGSLCPVYLRRICRKCRTARSRVKYTIEHDRWLLTRSPSITPCPRDGVKSLHLGAATLVFFPDFEYDRKDFDFVDNGSPCKHASVFLLHLYDSKSRRLAAVTDFFLVLRKAIKSPGDSFERVGIVTIEFKSRREREMWFREEYDKICEGNKPVTIV